MRPILLLNLRPYLFVACLSLLSSNAFADTPDTNPDTSNAAAITELKASIMQRFPGSTPSSVVKSPLAGLYEVTIGAKLYYFSADGGLLIRGTIVDLNTGKNLTEPRRSAIRKTALEAVGDTNMIVYKADKQRFVLTVFTDIDCGYCRKLHADIEKYQAAGVTVRYLFYPRSGLRTPSYDKAVNVWCSKDRQAALTAAKANQRIENKSDCENPVRDHMVLADDMGINSTPALITDSGELIRGYAPAAQIVRELEQLKQASR